jgi:carbohydrate diacid regulator
MFITNELAQQVVDNIIPIVRQNINIMNDSGIIVGSGQKDRINCYHHGAINVLKSSAVVEIFPHQLKEYPGSLPGVNWPIVLGKQIVGVVGVSGHPDEVRETAKLVKMVTELILEREILIEQFRSHSHLKEQFAQLLLSEQAIGNYPQVTKIANLLRFELGITRLVAVVNIKPILEAAYNQHASSNLLFARTKESLTHLLETSPLVTDKDMFILGENELIIFKHFSVDTNYDAFEQWGGEIIELLSSLKPSTPILMGIGSLTNSPVKLFFSYNEALFNMINCLSNCRIASIYNFDLLVSYLFKNPAHVNHCLAFKRLKEKVTNKIDRKYDMKNTIKSLLDNNLNVTSTAKTLFIHRNTLVYRLEKLKELTGLCPSQFLNHAILCKLLLQQI